MTTIPVDQAPAGTAMDAMDNYDGVCISENITPEYKYRLILHPELWFEFNDFFPNWWWRMWTRILLGWKWERI